MRLSNNNQTSPTENQASETRVISNETRVISPEQTLYRHETSVTWRSKTTYEICYTKKHPTEPSIVTPDKHPHSSFKDNETTS